MRHDVRQVVIDRLGDPDGVLAVDETGGVKKGVHTVGVQRQYTGTAGRIENAQVSVFLPTPADMGNLDRLPDLPARVLGRQPAPPRTGRHPRDCRVRHPLAACRRHDHAAWQAATPARWVTADEAYGNNSAMRARLHALRLGYVLAISRDTSCPSTAGGPGAAPTISSPGYPRGPGPGAAPVTALGTGRHVSTDPAALTSRRGRGR